MKQIYLVLLLFTQVAVAQSFSNDFEDSSLQEWINADASTDNLSVQENAPFHFLQKYADGSNSPLGELAIVNESSDYWLGNYFYNPSNGNSDTTLRNIDDITVKNTNDFDLYLRYAFEGANGYQVVTTEPIIVPANTDWDIYASFFSIENTELYNLTVLNDVSGLPAEEVVAIVMELFSDVVAFKILHNEAISFDGATIIGDLQIESIYSYELLANPDNSPELLSVYPNPMGDVLFIKTNSIEKGMVELLNVLGKVVLSQPITIGETKVNTQQLNSGVYLASITINGAIHTKKVVKL